MRQHSFSSVLFECVGMFVRGHVLIYLAACMCVVALEGGHRHKEKKKLTFVIWQHKMSSAHKNTQTDI